LAGAIAKTEKEETLLPAKVKTAGLAKIKIPA
jgi:hypothetical protein